MTVSLSYSEIGSPGHYNNSTKLKKTMVRGNLHLGRDIQCALSAVCSIISSPKDKNPKIPHQVPVWFKRTLTLLLTKLAGVQSQWAQGQLYSPHRFLSEGGSWQCSPSKPPSHKLEKENPYQVFQSAPGSCRTAPHPWLRGCAPISTDPFGAGQPTKPDGSFSLASWARVPSADHSSCDSLVNGSQALFQVLQPLPELQHTPIILLNSTGKKCR